MKIFSFFSGLGFLDLGFELAGFELAYTNELSPAFLSAQAYSRQQMGLNPPTYGSDLCSAADLLAPPRSTNFSSILHDARKDGSLIGFVAGPPCPDFSVAGKNKGSEGDRGKLTETYVELICKFLPDFFLFENVKGLWSTAKHRAYYDQMKAQLERSGYKITDNLFNTLQFGVPQSRQRVMAIGFLSSLTSARLGGDLHHRFSWSRNKAFLLDCVTNYPWPTIDPFGEDSSLNCPVDIPAELTVQRWFTQNDVNNHPNATHHFVPRAGLSKFLSIAEGDDGKKSSKRLHRWRYSPTACYGNNEVHLHPYKARRISIAEALAIQSLPKEFELPPTMTLTDMFKGVGNGVPLLAAQGIAKSIHQVLQGV
jgi:DNA (cytosine-5)-methyltransferase 1